MNHRTSIFILLTLLLTATAFAGTVSVTDQGIKRILVEKLDTQDNVKPSAKKTAAAVKTTSEKKNKRRKNRSADRCVDFNYTNKPLIEIIYELAAEKKLNIFLPADEITTKITYRYPTKLTVDEAWDLLATVLKDIGYTFAPKDGMLTYIKNNDKEIDQRAVLDYYSRIPVTELPDSDTLIRYVYHFEGGISAQNADTGIRPILTDMLSPTAYIKFDTTSNTMILIDKASNIKAAMTIIVELDEWGERDAIEVFPLYYTSAKLVERILTNLIGGGTPQRRGEQAVTTKNAYFAPNTRVLALERSNSIIIMGTVASVDTVKDVIVKFLDVLQDVGESVLHTYDLQYLDATTFAGTLDKLINAPSQPAAAGTAGAQTTGQQTGPQKYFRDVIIVAEKSGAASTVTNRLTRTEFSSDVGDKKAKGTKTDITATEGSHLGGNRLVVAAHKDDWMRIKTLIQELDKPQRQVAFEVLIVDVTLSKNKILGNQLRNKLGFNNSIERSTNFQSSQLSNPIVTTGNPPNGLAANLLQLAGASNLATSAPSGSLLISFQDPNKSSVWSLWEILDAYADTTILSQPYLITLNNTTAHVKSEQSHYVVAAVKGDNVNPPINNEYISAAIAVDILPRISADNTINLQIVVNINQFLGNSNSDNDRTTRFVQTDAHVGNNEILSLGGLTTLNEQLTINKTPILGDIPLIGWLFRFENKLTVKTNLLVFIKPMIIEPYRKGGYDPYSGAQMDYALNQMEDHVTMENLRDPITRWFFQPDLQWSKNVIKNYEKQALFEESKEKGSYTLAQQKEDQQRAAEDIKKLVQNEENPLLRIEQGKNEAVLNS